MKANTSTVVSQALQAYGAYGLKARDESRVGRAGESTAEKFLRPPGADTFEIGQPWKNRSVGTAASMGGSALGRAAQAYEKQAQEGRQGVRGAENPAAQEPLAAAESSPERSLEATESAVEGQKDQEEETAESDEPRDPTGAPLTSRQRMELAYLQQVDAAVRAHERAHLAAAGSLATSGAAFQYATGPDGKKYAVGGEVGIDTSSEADPEKTISKMRTVRSAALAPAVPSPQDRKVAASASRQMEEAARQIRTAELESMREQGTRILSRVGGDADGNQTQEENNTVGVSAISLFA